MRTEEQIRVDVIKQIIDTNKTQLNDELSQVEKDLEEAYKTKIEKDVEYALESAQTGYVTSSGKSIDTENRKFQEELINLKSEKDKIDKKLKALEEFK